MADHEHCILVEQKLNILVTLTNGVLVTLTNGVQSELMCQISKLAFQLPMSLF